MPHDYSNMHTNVTHTSNLQHFYAMINSPGFIDIYEYLDDKYVMPTSKLINDDVDKTPVEDYKNPLHIDVVDRCLRRMGDKTIPDEAPFYPP